MCVLRYGQAETREKVATTSSFTIFYEKARATVSSVVLQKPSQSGIIYGQNNSPCFNTPYFYLVTCFIPATLLSFSAVLLY